MTKEYIYSEPDIATRKVYVDCDGNSHDTRDGAIAASITGDVRRHIATELSRAWPDASDECGFIASALALQIANPRNKFFREMVRDLIECTD